MKKFICLMLLVSVPVLAEEIEVGARTSIGANQNVPFSIDQSKLECYFERRTGYDTQNMKCRVPINMQLNQNLPNPRVSFQTADYKYGKYEMAFAPRSDRNFVLSRDNKSLEFTLRVSSIVPLINKYNPEISRETLNQKFTQMQQIPAEGYNQDFVIGLQKQAAPEAFSAVSQVLNELTANKDVSVKASYSFDFNPEQALAMVTQYCANDNSGEIESCKNLNHLNNSDRSVGEREASAPQVANSQSSQISNQ